jgi:hypothetical protein
MNRPLDTELIGLHLAITTDAEKIQVEYESESVETILQCVVGTDACYAPDHGVPRRCPFRASYAHEIAESESCDLSDYRQ